MNSFICNLVACLSSVLLLADGQESQWLLQSDAFPSDPRLVPAVGNGNVATQVLSDTVYLNNVYNGRENNTHRARIPSMVALSVEAEFESSLYTLDMFNGVFTVNQTGPEFSVFRRVYAHRTRPSLLLHEIQVTRRQAQGEVRLPLHNNSNNESADMDLVTVPSALGSWLTYGQTYEYETNEPQFQFMYNYWSPHPAELVLVAGETDKHWLFISSVSVAEPDAWNDYEAAVRDGPELLYEEHSEAWQGLWASGHIQVYEDVSLAQTLNAAMFHILVSMPDTQDRNNPFGGLSPGGLARGGIVEPDLSSPYNDYLGHVFWDMDTWIMPALLLFHPHMARLSVQARTRVLEQARENAAMGGHRGARFPWEQAYTGSEVSPWDLAALYQIHVTADVSYALRQYLYATRDLDLLTEDGGRSLAMDIARFWQSRAVLQDTDKGYEILGVMGPDEYASNVNNSVFTNYNALLSLSLPAYLHDTLGIAFNASELEEISGFDAVADAMFLVFDPDIQYHPQYEGFQIENTTIKQSDVVLLGYPLMKNMTETVRRNDLEIYEQLTDKNGPDTGTWSMHTVGWLELGDWERANQMFSYMFRNINGPFKIFSEKPANGSDGMRATNFITLAGGLLQSVMYGYGGVRILPHQLDLQPALLPDSRGWEIQGLTYRGASLSMSIQTEGVVTVELIDTGAEPVLLYTWQDCERTVLEPGSVVTSPWDKLSLVVESEESEADLCQEN